MPRQRPPEAAAGKPGSYAAKSEEQRLSKMLRSAMKRSSAEAVRVLAGEPQLTLVVGEAFELYEEMLRNVADMVNSAERDAQVQALRGMARRMAGRRVGAAVRCWSVSAVRGQLARLRLENEAARSLVLKQTKDMMRLAEVA